MSATCGPRYATPFAYYDPDTSSVRMCEGTLALDSIESSVTLPPSGIACGGRLYALPTSALHMGAPDCSSLLPTPNVAGGGKKIPEDAVWSGKAAYKPDGTKVQVHIDRIAMLLPTPTVDDLSNVTRESGEYQSLTRTARLLPTPAVNDMGRGKTVEDWDAWTDKMQAKHGNGNGHGKSLEIEAQRLLPTPTGSDAKGSSPGHSEAVRDMVLLPTPRASDGPKGGPGQTGDGLQPAVRHLLPTPTAEPGGDGQRPDGFRRLLEPEIKRLHGATTPPPSPVGSTSSGDQLPLPPTTEDG